MDEKFTQNLLKFIFALFLGFFINPLNLSAQNCDVPTGMNETNISNFSATLIGILMQMLIIIDWDIKNLGLHLGLMNIMQQVFQMILLP